MDNKTLRKTLIDHINEIEGREWDLAIIANALTAGLENESIVIQDVRNDPVRLVLIALNYIREDLIKQCEELHEICDQLKEDGEKAEK